MLPKAHLTSHPGCLALGEWSYHRDYLGHEDLFCTVSVYSCHLLLISSEFTEVRANRAPLAASAWGNDWTSVSRVMGSESQFSCSLSLLVTMTVKYLELRDILREQRVHNLYQWLQKIKQKHKQSFILYVASRTLVLNPGKDSLRQESQSQ